jgi:hypothetical protein
MTLQVSCDQIFTTEKRSSQRSDSDTPRAKRAKDAK